MRTVVLYPYDPQLRPGTLGADFESDNPNETFTLRLEAEDAEYLMQQVRTFLQLDPESR